MAREHIILACEECKRRNYTFFHNKATGKLSLKKFCRFCRKHTLHKQTK